MTREGLSGKSSHGDMDFVLLEDACPLYRKPNTIFKCLTDKVPIDWNSTLVFAVTQVEF